MFDRFGWVIQLAITVLVGRYFFPPGWGILTWVMALAIGLLVTWLLALVVASFAGRKRE
jgi:hypothetical protein